jgi:hypothetical protein
VPACCNIDYHFAATRGCDVHIRTVIAGPVRDSQGSGPAILRRSDRELRLVVVGVLAGVAVLTSGLVGAASPAPAGAQSSAQLLALDVTASGNDSRTVGTVEECVSASVGQAVDVDVVVPGSGIPTDRGMAAYQFSLLYDPSILWVQADNGKMLLDQAPGSNVITIADPKPDKNGLYVSWGVDFGPSGIEPAGSSEVGPGVIARLTLLPQAAGRSALALGDVLVIDDDSQRIELEDIQPAAIHVGEPCPGESDPSVDPEPTGSEPVDTSDPLPPAADPLTGDPATDPSGGAPGQLTEPADFADAVPAAGGQPPPAAAANRPIILAGLTLSLAGGALLTLGRCGQILRTAANRLSSRRQ